MGRLRNKRRGGGVARTINGLTRTGTANKLIGSKGGVQNPIVGEATNGEIVEVVNPAQLAPTQTTLRARHTAALLMGVDWENGAGVDETNPPEATFGYTTRGDTLLTWTNNTACTFTFWVF